MFLKVLNVCYCSRVRGASLKILLQRCKNLRCLLLNQTNLESEHVMAAEWEKAEQLQVSFFIPLFHCFVLKILRVHFFNDSSKRRRLTISILPCYLQM